MKKLTLASVKKVARKYGATVDDSLISPDYCCVNVDAPTGKVWACDDLHYIVINVRSHDYYADAIERMEKGIEECTVTDCDICEERREYDKDFPALKLTTADFIAIADVENEIGKSQIIKEMEYFPELSENVRYYQKLPNGQFLRL